MNENDKQVVQLHTIDLGGRLVLSSQRVVERSPDGLRFDILDKNGRVTAYAKFEMVNAKWSFYEYGLNGTLQQYRTGIPDMSTLNQVATAHINTLCNQGQ